ncbi:MAG TPA: formylglycine-generating enzyme family protein [Usitatibacter sp.]|nr:formylglycine-generating enzyme family protein [Usitatibacter sp.]
MEVKPCCAPSNVAIVTLARPVRAPAKTAIATDWCSIPGGEFIMGTDSDEGFATDGEGPARSVSLAPFRIAATAVSNREFGDFVRATRYVTQAEQLGQSFVFYLQVDPAVRAAARQVPAGLPWWLAIDDASWQRPEGPGSHVHDRREHPVVHVSWHDAKAYCEWAGARLPTEPEWECAARGALMQKRYPWGDELRPDGETRCNIWQGVFPNAPAAGWQPGTMPVHSFAPNGWGLYNTSGNVWEWCEDWFSAGTRAMRGGSFLCHDSYCNRYRVAARSSNTPSSAASNIGFRLAL